MFPRAEFVESWGVTTRSYIHKSLKAALRCFSSAEQLKSSLNFQWSMLLCNWLLWLHKAIIRYVMREELWPRWPVPSWFMQMVLKPPIELAQARFRCGPGVQAKVCYHHCLCFLDKRKERRETPNSLAVHKNRSSYKPSWFLVLILFWLSVYSWLSVSKALLNVCESDRLHKWTLRYIKSWRRRVCPVFHSLSLWRICVCLALLQCLNTL